MGKYYLNTEALLLAPAPDLLKEAVSRSIEEAGNLMYEVHEDKIYGYGALYVCQFKPKDKPIYGIVWEEQRAIVTMNAIIPQKWASPVPLDYGKLDNKIPDSVRDNVNAIFDNRQNIINYLERRTSCG